MELSIREGNEMLLDVQVESGAFAFIKSMNYGEQYKEFSDMSAQERDSYKKIENIMQNALAQVQKIAATELQKAL
jgi:RNA polymerase-interacting CarD/CdnL/TRCF family regulator